MWPSRGLRQLLGASALLLCIAIHCSDAAETQDPVALGQSLLAGLSIAAPPSEFARVAREFGNAVDAARRGAMGDEILLRIRELANEMRRRTEDRLRAAESETGDSEAALEQLYRSAAWDDLSFALTAFPYWRAWVDLTLAERPSRAGERTKRLWQAKRGFRTASMQIFQPSLVYGGWLGLGYVALAEGAEDRARSIFEALERALVDDPANPVRIVVATELRLMRAERGEVATAEAGTGPVDTAETAALRAEALTLLERHQATEVGAREAAARLRRIIDAGQLDMGLLIDILAYQKEIVREDLGVYTDLIGAEYAFTNQQYYTAVQKYKAFFKQPPRAPQLDFTRFRYRYAVACYKSDLTDDAARLAEQLLQTPRLDAETKRAAIKLAYVARAQRRDAHASRQAQQALTQAARRFIDTSPADPDADGARLILAQQAGDTGAALKLLDGVSSSARLQGGVERMRFYTLAKAFSEQSRKPGAALELLASQALSAWQDLPSAERKGAENQALFTQLQAVADPDPERILKAVERAEQLPAAGLAVKRAYFWSRLKCYDRLGRQDLLLGYIEALGERPMEGWQLEPLYPWIKGLASLDLQISLITALQPKLKVQPEMERRFRLLQIESLLASQRAEEAYGAAGALLEDYPRAGDGYRLLATAAQQSNRPLEADRAWGVITAKVDPNGELWWEGMLNRIEIRGAAPEVGAPCELIAEVRRRPQAPSPAYTSRLDALSNRIPCEKS